MLHTEFLFRFLEGLHQYSPSLFWTVVGFLCGSMFLILVWAAVGEAVARLRRQQFNANHRLLLWGRVGGFVVLYVTMVPVVLITFTLWEEFKSARQFFSESPETR